MATNGETLYVGGNVGVTDQSTVVGDGVVYVGGAKSPFVPDPAFGYLHGFDATTGAIEICDPLVFD